ncbi:Similar to hypothetical protein [Tuber melanosporum Mel28]; acc. no. XP_002841573 [Pyronema omphalodes CBS 100304]|uniref:Uncharacterized protein n=1 Tax=Pyronema omphalodes (strain CBS 100304) TaxID=1076935 RepID=U4KUC6_PYROM|nr:Similar to hypothetical protein [Tuber melanosporum Mel28]; acc. no. XP_002841573 [Pyronema omphalodes CBS 100304]
MPPVDDTNTSNSEGDNVEDEAPPKKRTTTTSVVDSDDMRASTSKLRQKRKSRRGTMWKGTDRGRKRVKLDGKATKRELSPDKDEDDDEPRGTIRVAQTPSALGPPADRNAQPSSSGGTGKKYPRRNSTISNNLKTPTIQTTRRTRSSMDGQLQNSTRKTSKKYFEESNDGSSYDSDSSSLSPVPDWEDEEQGRGNARGGFTRKGRAMEKDLIPKKISSSNKNGRVEIPETPQNSGPSVSPVRQPLRKEHNRLEVRTPIREKATANNLAIRSDQKTIAPTTDPAPKPKRTLQPTDLAPTPYDPAKLPSLKFRLFRFPTKKKARNLEITGASISDPETGNVSWPLLKALIERTWVTDLDHDMLLVNWFFRITKQTDLDRCVGQLCKYERPSHEIILCEQYVGPGKIPPSSTDEMIDKLRENDANFWRGRWESVDAAKPEEKVTSNSASSGDLDGASTIPKKVDSKKDTITDDASTNTKEATPIASAAESSGIKRRPTRGASLSNSTKAIAMDETPTEVKEHIPGSSRRVTRRSSLSTVVHNPLQTPEQNSSLQIPARTSMKSMDDLNEPTPKRRAIEAKTPQETNFSSTTSGKTSRRVSRRVSKLEQSAGLSETEDENTSSTSKLDKSTSKADLATRETSTDSTARNTPDTTSPVPHQPGKRPRGRPKRIPGSSAAPSKGFLVQRQDPKPPPIQTDPSASMSTGQGAFRSAPPPQKSAEPETPVTVQTAVSQPVIVADMSRWRAVSSRHSTPLSTEQMSIDGESVASPAITEATQATVGTAVTPSASESAPQQAAENSQPSEPVAVAVGAGADNDFEAIDAAAEFLLMAFMDIDNPPSITPIPSSIPPSEKPTEIPNETPQEESKKRGRWANHIKKTKPVPKSNTRSKPGRKSLTTVLKVSPGALRSATADVSEETSEPVASAQSPEPPTLEVPEAAEAVEVGEVAEVPVAVEAVGGGESAENGDVGETAEVRDAKETGETGEVAPGSPSPMLTPPRALDALPEAPLVLPEVPESSDMMSPPGTSPPPTEMETGGLEETVVAEPEIEEGEIVEAPLVEKEPAPAPKEPTPVPELEDEENEVEEGEIVESKSVQEPVPMELEAEAVVEPKPTPGLTEKESTPVPELVEEPGPMQIEDEPAPEPDQVPVTVQQESTPAPEPESVPEPMEIESESEPEKVSIPVPTEEECEPASERVPVSVPAQKESQLEPEPEATAPEPTRPEPANTVEQTVSALSSKASVEAPVEPSKEVPLAVSASSTTSTATVSRAATPAVTTAVAETVTTETVAAVPPGVATPAATAPAVTTPVIPDTPTTDTISVSTPFVTAIPAVKTPAAPFTPAVTVITTASTPVALSTPTTDVIPTVAPTPNINAVPTAPLIPSTNAAPAAPLAFTTETSTTVPSTPSPAAIPTVAPALAANAVTPAPLVPTAKAVSNDPSTPSAAGIQPPPRSAFKPAYTASPIIPQPGFIPSNSTTPKTPQGTLPSRPKRKSVTLESLKPTRTPQPRKPLPTNVIPLSSLPPVPTVAPTIPRPQPYRRPGVRVSAPMLLPPKPPAFIPGGRLPPRPPAGMGPARSSTQAPVPGQAGNPLPSRPSSQGSASSAPIPTMVNGQPLNWALGEELANARKKSEEARRSPGGPLNWGLGEELANARKKSEEQRRNGRLDSLRANMPKSSHPPANRMTIPRPAYGKPAEGEHPIPIHEQQPTHRGNQPSYRPSISNPVGTGQSAIAHELPRPPAYVPKPRPLATSPNAPSAKMEPLVRPGNFLYQEPVPTPAPPKPLTGSSEWKLPTLERTDSPALPLTAIPGAATAAPAPQARNSFGFPPAVAALEPPVPMAPKPNEVLFVVHRFQDPAIKLCVPGADITVNNRLEWEGLVRIISGNLRFNDSSESLVVNNLLLVKDQETLSKGFDLMAYRRGPNEVVIVNVDEKGQPKEKSILEAMEKGRRLLKGVVG